MTEEQGIKLIKTLCITLAIYAIASGLYYTSHFNSYAVAIPTHLDTTNDLTNVKPLDLEPIDKYWQIQASKVALIPSLLFFFCSVVYLVIARFRKDTQKTNNET